MCEQMGGRVGDANTHTDHSTPRPLRGQPIVLEGVHGVTARMHISATCRAYGIAAHMLVHARSHLTM